MQLTGAIVPMQGGRSNHVWRLLGEPDCVLKVFEARASNPMFANDAGREVACLTRLAGSGMAPELVTHGSFEGYAWVLYRHLSGSPWTQGPDIVAQLLGRLHACDPLTDLPLGCNGSQDQRDHALRILAGCSDAVRYRLLALRPDQQVAPVARRVLVHGDPVPGNLVAHDGTVSLIDWQCPVLGDPAEDIGIFLSPAMQHLYRGDVLSSAEVEGFLSAYPDPDVVHRYRLLAPWLHWRMAAYCAWRAEHGKSDYAEALELEVAVLEDQRSRAARTA
ncbi:MAG: aminoglycoside phosphotransferase family protein [Rhodobacteraceae bacterium]|nr:aminoglycoside phosphotransferase family protein [Paracoccaceae bacterium]